MVRVVREAPRSRTSTPRPCGDLELRSDRNFREGAGSSAEDGDADEKRDYRYPRAHRPLPAMRLSAARAASASRSCGCPTNRSLVTVRRAPRRCRVLKAWRSLRSVRFEVFSFNFVLTLAASDLVTRRSATDRLAPGSAIRADARTVHASSHLARSTRPRCRTTRWRRRTVSRSARAGSISGSGWVTDPPPTHRLEVAGLGARRPDQQVLVGRRVVGHHVAARKVGRCERGQIRGEEASAADPLAPARQTARYDRSCESNAKLRSVCVPASENACGKDVSVFADPCAGDMSARPKHARTTRANPRAPGS